MGNELPKVTQQNMSQVSGFLVGVFFWHAEERQGKINKEERQR